MTNCSTTSYWTSGGKTTGIFLAEDDGNSLCFGHGKREEDIGVCIIDRQEEQQAARQTWCTALYNQLSAPLIQADCNTWWDCDAFGERSLLQMSFWRTVSFLPPKPKPSHAATPSYPLQKHLHAQRTHNPNTQRIFGARLLKPNNCKVCARTKAEMCVCIFIRFIKL